MNCAICELRRPRRYCPGIHGDICSICCGTEREVTVDCPFECEYLQEARYREKLPAVNEEDVPNPDIKVTEKFLRENEPLTAFIAGAILSTAFENPGTNDYDVREALESLIKTYRTLESGLIYESRPANPLAANLCGAFQNAVSEIRQSETERRGLARTRDKDILGVLVFMQRLELDYNNGRKRGRAFIDFLRQIAEDFARHAETAKGDSPLVL